MSADRGARLRRGLTGQRRQSKTQHIYSVAAHHFSPPVMQAATENGTDEVHLEKGPKRKKRAWEEDSDEGPDSEEEREKQRQEDQREKEEFEQRLRDRDEAKTRKLMEAKLSKEEIEVRSAPAGLPW